jgi:Reverse transcriptase (RNA-dependent DNA polymerase)
VINDVSFRIILVSTLIWELQASINVETAILHGELHEEIYMNVPEELDTNSNHCLQIKKTIYGLVQSAREFYKKLILLLKMPYPCLLSKCYKDGVMLIGVWMIALL